MDTPRPRDLHGTPPRVRRRDRILAGPPLALPRSLDRLSEAWAGAPPRARLAVGALVALLVLAAAGRGATTSRWGAPVGVVTAVADLPAGHRVTAADVTASAWPADLAPGDALAAPTDVIGALTARQVRAGAPIGAADLDASGAASDLRPDHVAVAIASDGLPALSAGQFVDLLGLDPVDGGVVLADGARVISDGGAVIWFEVTRGQAAAVAGAAARGGLSVALLPRR